TILACMNRSSSGGCLPDPGDKKVRSEIGPRPDLQVAHSLARTLEQPLRVRQAGSAAAKLNGHVVLRRPDHTHRLSRLMHGPPHLMDSEAMGRQYTAPQRRVPQRNKRVGSPEANGSRPPGRPRSLICLRAAVRSVEVVAQEKVGQNPPETEMGRTV